MALFNRNRDDQDQSGLGVIDSQNDLDSQELGMPSKLTSLEDSSIKEDSHPFEVSDGGTPPSVDRDEMDSTAPTKKSSKLPLIIGGAAGVLALSFAGVLLMGGDGGSQPTQPVETASEATPSLPTISSSDVATSEVMTPDSELIGALDIQASDVAMVQPVVASDATPTASVPVVAASDVGVKPTPVNTASQPQSKQDEGLSTAHLSQDVEPVIPPATTVKPSNQTTGIPSTTVNAEEAKTKSDELRAQAQQLILQAEALEKSSKIDALLEGKTTDEQIAILKSKIVEYETALATPKGCTAKPSRQGLNKSNNQKRSNNRGQSPAKKLETAAIVEGQVWFKGNNYSYTVGDRLPNGAVIKSVHADTNTIQTNRGTFKAN